MQEASTEKLRKFSDRLKAARKNKGYTQQKLAELLGLSYGTIGNWEAGRNDADGENLKNLAEILGVSQGWLIEGETDLREFQVDVLLVVYGRQIPLSKLARMMGLKDSELLEMLIGNAEISQNVRIKLREIGSLEGRELRAAQSEVAPFSSMIQNWADQLSQHLGFSSTQEFLIQLVRQEWDRRKDEITAASAFVGNGQLGPSQEYQQKPRVVSTTDKIGKQALDVLEGSNVLPHAPNQAPKSPKKKQASQPSSK